MKLVYVKGAPDLKLLELGNSVISTSVFIEVDRVNDEIRAGIQGETTRILLPRDITVYQVNRLIKERAEELRNLATLKPYSNDNALLAVELFDSFFNSYKGMA